jgi:zinc protease
MRARGLLIALAVLLLPCAASAGVFYPESFTLDNGLQIVVVPNHLAPAVTQMVWYKVGSTDEVAGKTGLAHYLEHLMFRGTATVAPGDFSKRIAAQGGNDNAFTSYDYTAFYETVASDRLPMIMQLEADRMQNLRITPAVATPELRVVLDERQQRTDNDPHGRFEERLNRLLLPQQPYGVPVIGWKPEIEKLTAADADDFYKKHYAPNNAVVVITGDVDLDEVKKLAAETYGRVPKREVAMRASLPTAGDPAMPRLVVTDAGVEQPQFEWHAIVPSYSTQKDHEAYAFEVLAEVLDGGQVGALYRDLVTAQSLASGIDTYYDPDARGETTFSIAVVPQPGKDAAALEPALRDELQKLAHTGLDAKSIDDAKKRLQRVAVFARDSLMTAGYAFGSALATGHTVADVEAWPDRIAAVTPAEVNDALKYLVADPHAIAGLLLPDPNATPEARAAAKPMLSHGESIR